MKTIPPPCSEPLSGQRYWRSLDQLADSPEFQQWVEREFPAGASEFSDPIGRRHFIKIMSASFLLAGLGVTGCRRPEEKILPFGKAPENFIHGVAQFYATAMPTRGSAIPLVVKAHDGRPTKIEGNKDHPDSNGATDTFAQASILGLYDPDRSQRFTKGGNEVPREQAFDALKQLAAAVAANGGAGLAFLVERSSSPSRARLRDLIMQKFSKAQWIIYEPLHLEMNRTVAGNLAGQPLSPYYKLDAAKVILSLDCDFIGSEQDTYIHCRNYARGRKITKPTDTMNRLYSVEGLLTQTGMNADHRLRVPTTSALAVTAAIAAQIVDNPQVKALAGKFALPSNVKQEWIVECANDLKANQGASLVMAGYRQPGAVHVLANLINAALQNNGKTVLFLNTPQEAATGTITDLANGLRNGQVNTLVVLGGNPVLNAPADFDWKTLQRRAQNIVRLGYYEDETFPITDWHFPMAHYLESWGDARTADGTLVAIQPLIAPLFGGVTELEVLGVFAGLQSLRPYDIARETFGLLAGGDSSDVAWKKFLHNGFLANSAAAPVNAAFAPDKITSALNSAAAADLPAKEKLEIVFQRDYKIDDGRYNNNGWLQELPDPITKTVWDGLVLVSRVTAADYGVVNDDVVEIELNGRKIQGPIWIQPGLADYSVSLALGYGRQRSSTGGTGRVGDKVGLYNGYDLRTTASEHAAVGGKLRRTGAVYKVACTQEHGSMEGRPIIREATLEQFKKKPDFAKNMDLESHSDYVPKDPKTGFPVMIYEHPYKGFELRKGQSGVKLTGLKFASDIHQWGMSIDLNACVGCSSCVLACQSENNVPIVGKEQVYRNREMHWLRIDRYFSGAYDRAKPQLIDDPQVVNQPMLCQHCENAPCESVCPVNATVHDEEGLNVMAYNRCVGTRYCSNNCPYKVRRFNFFDYNKRQLGPKLYKNPITTVGDDGKWELARWWNDPASSSRPEDEWELSKLVKNPDVTVRMRGVMEKCTFCVQRIEGAKIAQKVKVGQSGDVRVPDGVITPACAQACPAEAIVFGNMLDPNSRVSQLKRQERDYTVLGFLDTRPRLTYLARLRNPNPKMPDYYETPLNIAEYEKREGGGEGGGYGGGHGEPNNPEAKPAAEKGIH